MIFQGLEVTYVALRKLYRPGSDTPSAIMFLVLSPAFMAALFLMFGSFEIWNIRVSYNAHSTAPVLAVFALVASWAFGALFLVRRGEVLEKRYARLPSLKPIGRRIVCLSAIYITFLGEALLAIHLPIVSLAIFAATYGAVGLSIRRLIRE